MRDNLFFYFCFLKGWQPLFSSAYKRWLQSYQYNTLSNNGLRQKSSISLQLGTNSGACLVILELWFHWGIFFIDYVALFYARDVAGLVSKTYLIGCCDIIPIQSWIRVQSIVIFITLVNMTYQSGGPISLIYSFLG